MILFFLLLLLFDVTTLQMARKPVKLLVENPSSFAGKGKNCQVTIESPLHVGIQYTIQYAHTKHYLLNISRERILSFVWMLFKIYLLHIVYLVDQYILHIKVVFITHLEARVICLFNVKNVVQEQKSCSRAPLDHNFDCAQSTFGHGLSNDVSFDHVLQLSMNGDDPVHIYLCIYILAKHPPLAGFLSPSGGVAPSAPSWRRLRRR